MKESGLTQWATFYAELANATGRLAGARRRRLIQRFARLVDHRTPPHVQRAAEDYFDIIHARARSWVLGLLDGGGVTPDAMMGQVMWVLDQEDEVVRASWPKANETLLGELVELIQQRPFPWRRCPVCGVVFLRDGKRRYCPGACTEAQQRQSRHTDEHRERMRLYMREHRRRAKRKRDKARADAERAQVARIRAGG